jgi:hypothetical protein
VRLAAARAAFAALAGGLALGLGAGAWAGPSPDFGLLLDGPVAQGALVPGSVAPGTRLSIGGKVVRVDPDGRFVIGFGRDAIGPARLEFAGPDGVPRVELLEIIPRHWQIQHIDGLPSAQVNPDGAALERIRAEQRKLDAARAVDSTEQGYRQAFAWPATGPISGVYGSQRILNGEPRAPHVGLDIAAPEGAPVLAPADAVVRLAEPDLFFTGRTIILDHGHGVTTLYAHLSALAVQPGQRLAQGEVIGRVGKTGRVTGPHLHWALYWLGTALDPAQLLPNPPNLGN